MTPRADDPTIDRKNDSEIRVDVAAGGRWRLHPRVALRPEPFGALAYHYDSRKLNFLRSPDLVNLVRDLENHDSVRTAFDHAGLADSQWRTFASALNALAASEFIVREESTDRTPS